MCLTPGQTMNQIQWYYIIGYHLHLWQCCWDGRGAMCMSNTTLSWQDSYEISVIII